MEITTIVLAVIMQVTSSGELSFVTQAEVPLGECMSNAYEINKEPVEKSPYVMFCAPMINGDNIES